MAAWIQRPDGTALYFDLTTEERHAGNAEVTEFPIEEGSDIVDNVRPKPTPLTLRCFVTNTPLVPSGNQPDPGISTVQVTMTPYKPDVSVAGAILSTAINPIGTVMNIISGGDDPKTFSMPVLMFPADFDASFYALHRLQEMQDNAELLTVFTSIAEYDNMVLEHFELVRNHGTGTGAEVDLTFHPINFVSVDTAATPITTEPAAKPIKKKGPKDPQPDTTPKNGIAWTLVNQ